MTTWNRHAVRVGFTQCSQSSPECAWYNKVYSTDANSIPYIARVVERNMSSWHSCHIDALARSGFKNIISLSSAIHEAGTRAASPDWFKLIIRRRNVILCRWKFLIFFSISNRPLSRPLTVCPIWRVRSNPLLRFFTAETQSIEECLSFHPGYGPSPAASERGPQQWDLEIHNGPGNSSCAQSNAMPGMNHGHLTKSSFPRYFSPESQEFIWSA